ncbi:MAG: NAD(P)H-hydrate dehydratase [Gammaproteobacteria bacterium]
MNVERMLYRAEQVREFDRLAAESLSLPSYTLMTRAGESAFRALNRCWSDLHSVVILCGTGNNAGDGYVVGRLALEAGIRCQLLYLGERDQLSGDALTAARAYREAGGSESPFDHRLLVHADVIVDALLGIGLSRPLEGEWRAAVESVNALGTPVLALDVPSGLNSDTGEIMGAAIRAGCTLSFLALKAGLYTGEGPACAGRIELDRLGASEQVYLGVAPRAEVLTRDELSDHLLDRRVDAHKGMFGHVLVVGGNRGMGGAARLAGEAAIRTGAGLVSLCMHAGYVAATTAARPELMCHGHEDDEERLADVFSRSTVVAVGPGLGEDAVAERLFSRCLDAGKPLVVDASALNLLARAPQHRDDWILTPHPGEAARLLGVSTADIQSDRFGAVLELQARFGGACVLKGNGSLVIGKSRDVHVCPAGNPGMASGGMGDILTGIISALQAQGMSAIHAARSGVMAHAIAGDLAAERGQRGLIASDLLAVLRRVINPEP